MIVQILHINVVWNAVDQATQQIPLLVERRLDLHNLRNIFGDSKGAHDRAVLVAQRHFIGQDP